MTKTSKKLARRAGGPQLQPPRHAHVPLVLGDDGRRLAKRNASLHLHQLRAEGVPGAQAMADLMLSTE